jgi:hypothetical protein
MGDVQPCMPEGVPPLQFDDVAKSQVRDQVENVVRNY